MLFFLAVGSNTTYQPVSTTAVLPSCSSKDLPSGPLNLLWDVLHLGKIINTIKERCFSLKRLKTKREQGNKPKRLGIHTKKPHPHNNSPMTGAKKH